MPDAASAFLLNQGSNRELDVVPWAGTAAWALTPSGSAVFGQQSFARLSRFISQTLSEPADDTVGVEGWRRAGAQAGSHGVKYTVAWLSRLGRDTVWNRLIGSTWLSRNAGVFTLLSFAMQSRPWTSCRLWHVGKGTQRSRVTAEGTKGVRASEDPARHAPHLP